MPKYERCTGPANIAVIVAAAAARTCSPDQHLRVQGNNDVHGQATMQMRELALGTGSSCTMSTIVVGPRRHAEGGPAGRSCGQKGCKAFAPVLAITWSAHANSPEGLNG